MTDEFIPMGEFCISDKYHGLVPLRDSGTVPKTGILSMDEAIS